MVGISARQTDSWQTNGTTLLLPYFLYLLLPCRVSEGRECLLLPQVFAVALPCIA